MKNKKAVIGSTMTWVVAMVVILFIMIIYLFFVGIIFTKGTSGSKIEVKYTNSDLVLTHALLSFLESDAGNGETIEEIISHANSNDAEEKNRIQLFNENGKKFLNQNVPVGDGKPYFRTWIKVWSITDKVTLDGLSDNKFKSYSAENASAGAEGGITCNPTSGVNTQLIKIILAPDKKVVLCANGVY